MKHRVSTILNTMRHDDLLELKREVNEGRFDFNSLLEDTIRQKEKEHEKVCSMCGNGIKPQENNYTIMFGPDDFKKKATFCGQDCMSYFMDKMKEIKN
ncbi:MAG: hypothetical protein ACQEP1_00710 [Nanobdellota archaeon]